MSSSPWLGGGVNARPVGLVVVDSSSGRSVVAAVVEDGEGRKYLALSPSLLGLGREVILASELVSGAPRTVVFEVDGVLVKATGYPVVNRPHAVELLLDEVRFLASALLGQEARVIMVSAQGSGGGEAAPSSGDVVEIVVEEPGERGSGGGEGSG